MMVGDKPREMKSCPFCGGRAEVMVCNGNGNIIAKVGTEISWGQKMTHCLAICTKCGVRTKPYLTRRGMWNSWNRRVVSNNGKEE